MYKISATIDHSPCACGMRWHQRPHKTQRHKSAGEVLVICKRCCLKMPINTHSYRRQSFFSICVAWLPIKGCFLSSLCSFSISSCFVHRHKVQKCLLVGWLHSRKVLQLKDTVLYQCCWRLQIENQIIIIIVK